MKNLSVILYLIAVCACSATKTEESGRRIEPVNFSHVTINDEFWQPRLATHASVTLGVCLDQCEVKTARVRNFEIGAGERAGEFSGLVYDDSDLYKMIEGVAYSLTNNPNNALEDKMDKIIGYIAKTQAPDGYLMTYYILGDINKRWTNMDKHEMYCGGHLIEAAIAYFNATGKRLLLDVAIRYADHMMDMFGPGKRDWVPGHQEIELALVKLYYVTKERKYLDFAEWLINERGHGHGTWDAGNRDYYQDLHPVKKMYSISGHAVRAMYMFTGMADLGAAKSDAGYMEALDSLWTDVVMRNMYITGGIGSSRSNEGFTEDYDLPNLEAYCETCASVGMVFWNNRMNLMTGDGKYVDVMERSMYNGALSGISLSGNKFFYVNPLESDGNHHRQYWYRTACCPSQISRFLPSIGNYIYATSNDALWVNLFIGSEANIDFNGTPVTLSMETKYPWEGGVRLVVQTEKSFNAAFMVRIPGWCDKYGISVNGKAINVGQESGYARIKRTWKSGDIIELKLDMPVKVVASDPHVMANLGKRAVQRGPLIYCLEQTDNKNIDTAHISAITPFTYNFNSGLLNGVVEINTAGSNENLKFIPYYAWDNRDAGKMKVWVEYRE